LSLFSTGTAAALPPKKITPSNVITANSLSLARRPAQTFFQKKHRHLHFLVVAGASAPNQQQEKNKQVSLTHSMIMKATTHNCSTSTKFPRLAPAVLAAAALLTSAAAANAAGDEPWASPAPAPVSAPQTAPAVTAPASQTTPVSYEGENSLDWFVHVGVGVLLLSYSGGDSNYYVPDSVTLGGISFGGGRRLMKTETGSFLFYGEIGGYSGSHKFGYRKQHKIDDIAVPISLIAAYDFNVAENFSLLAGAHLGFTLLGGDATFEGGYEDEFRRTAFAGGVLVGANWKLSPKWEIDLSYKFAANSGIAIAENGEKSSSTTHQINVGFKYQF
jgi:opacity protein-like surface antigen